MYIYIYMYTFIYIHMCACIYESFYKYVCAIYMHIFMFTRVRVHHMIVCSACACACVHMITHFPPLVFHSPLKHILGLEMITRPAPVQIGVDGGKQIVGIVCKPHLQGLLMVCSDHEQTLPVLDQWRQTVSTSDVAPATSEIAGNLRYDGLF